MDYLRHFGLSREPFGNDPIPGFHFECPRQKAAELRLLRGSLYGKGLSVLVGGHGSGKTTLLRRLVEALAQDRYEAAVMVMVRSDVDPREFLQRVARLFGVASAPDDRGALMGQLVGRLHQIQERGLRAVAVIDEAQMLASDAILDELRGLLNLEGPQGRVLSLVLSGRPSLEARLAQHPPLLHRIDLKVRLDAFDAPTSARYLAERIGFAGGKPDILHADAAARIHELSGGVPRALTTLADNALYEAFLAGRGALLVEDVERAAHDLDLAGGLDVLEPVEEVISPLLPEPPTPAVRR